MRGLAIIFLGGVLAMSAIDTVASDFAPVEAGRALNFPNDFGAHPEYRTEWWYITGWLTDQDGRERGFQVTFFRSATGIGADNPSRFAPSQLILAHAAVADPATGHLRHADKGARALALLAGAEAGNTRAWIDNWALQRDADDYLTSIQADDFAFDLRLTPPAPPVLNGRSGFSQKTANPRNASYYYSRPQLAVTGQLTLDGHRLSVSGHAWLDHEWSSELLPEQAQGWDWIGINLNDGGSLMAFRMRGTDGAVLWAGGTLVQPGQAPRALGPDEIRFTPLRSWQSARTGVRYPVEWELDIAGQGLRLTPLIDDQELDARRSSGAIYWEGAVTVFAHPPTDQTAIGQGYLEMTGYWQRQSGL